MLGIFSDENEAQNIAIQTGTIPPCRFSSSNLSSIDSRQSFTSNVRRRHTDSEIIRSSKRGHAELTQPRLLSSVSIADGDVTTNDSSTDESQQSGDGLSEAFQNMIQTRRTSGRLIPLKTLPPLYEHEQDFWIDALDRAVRCGQQAPNHKRTEPFTFKRMIAVSEATKRLADIAYHVDMRKRLHPVGEGEPSDTEKVTAQQRAQRKREKWGQIPAFLVTVLSEETYNSEPVRNCHEYDPLPYQPPLTERALEDYAASCAAVQNVLLSLHSEHISTKWVTGPVVQTPAFRELLDLESTDRVVALIMVGARGETVSLRTRRNHRQLHGDVLVDL